MQVWRGSRATSLVSAFQPLLWLSRTFSTTVPLGRSKIRKVKEKKIGDEQQGWKPKRISENHNVSNRRRKERQSIVRSDTFVSVIEASLRGLKRELNPSSPELPHWDEFANLVIRASTKGWSLEDSDYAQVIRLKSRLEHTYLDSGPAELNKALKTELRNFMFDLEFSTHANEQKKLADFRYPAEWYPATRSLQREVHVHVGPTNSGKTYHALKKLEVAKTGFYAGPLRLLAHEVYSRLNAKGIKCGLITGDEVRIPDEPPGIYSNTVEMAPLGQEVDVGIIDEIQMIGDPQRGWAWTRAVLGARARELHLCGEERVVPLIRELIASVGDNLVVHRYERLNPLRAMSTSLKGNLKNLQKGDCVVAFSRITIHGLKQEIERVTGRRAAIVYGSLPAEIRSQQADLFNDPNNDYDFLVASDAIGMGLNLSCKRVIFESVVRKVPTGLERLSVSQIKQIGGRAGRYRSAAPGFNLVETDTSKPAPFDANQNVGFVTSLEDVDLPYIQEALKAQPQPISAAGILPPDSIARNFSHYFLPSTPFTYILQRLHNIAQTSPLFFLCDIKEQCSTCETIDSIEGLSVADRLVFMAAPASLRDPGFATTVRAFARCVAQHKSGALLNIPEVPLELLDQPVSGDRDYLRSLETLHRSIVLYLWLSYRCGGIFTDRTLATHVKELVEMKMDRALTEFSANRKLRHASSLRRQVALLKQQEEREQAYTSQRDNLIIKDGAGGSQDWETIASEVLDKMGESPQFSTAAT